MVLNAAKLKRLPAVQLPRPQHLVVVAREFLVEACLDVVEVCLEVEVIAAVDAAVAYLAVAVDAIVAVAAAEAVACLAVGGLDGEPLTLALQKPSAATTNSFLSLSKKRKGSGYLTLEQIETQRHGEHRDFALPVFSEQIKGDKQIKGDRSILLLLNL